MTLRSATKILLGFVLGLPVAQIVLMWARGLLLSMGDPDGAAMIGHLGTACEVAWALCLVGLVVVLALLALNDGAPDERE